MSTSNGTAVNFGFATTVNGITITGLTGLLFQNDDRSVEADKDEVRSGVGDIVNRNWYDQRGKATLEFVVTGAGLAAAITNTTLSNLLPGTFVAITACASDPDLVAANWEIQRASLKGSNTNAKRIVLELEKRAGLTAASGA